MDKTEKLLRKFAFKIPERKTISVETKDLMIDFAAHCMNMKNDDWNHSIDVDKDFAKEHISGFMESRYITNVEQEPLKIETGYVDEYYGYVAWCPFCESSWIMGNDENMHYCPSCGKAVKWDV